MDLLGPSSTTTAVHLENSETYSFGHTIILTEYNKK